MKKILNWAGKILTVIAIIYLIKYFYTVKIDFGLIDSWSMFIIVFICGSLLAMLNVFGSGYVWSTILASISPKKVNKRKAVRIYSKANLGKYLPGNVMHYIERNLFAAEIGLGQADTVLSSVLEIGMLLCAAVIIAILFLHDKVAEVLAETVEVYLIIILAAICIILIIAAVILYRKNEKFRDIIGRLCRKNVIKNFPKYILCYGGLLISMGTVLLMIFTGVMSCHLSVGQAFSVISFYVLAWMVGFVVPGAPGGIGVREFVLIFLLSSFVNEEFISFAIIIHRLITVIGDVLAYFAGFLIWGRKENNKLQ